MDRAPRAAPDRRAATSPRKFRHLAAATAEVLDRAPRAAPDRRAATSPRKFRHLAAATAEVLSVGLRALVGAAAGFAAALAAPCAAQNYADRVEVRAFVAEMVERHGFRPGELERVLAGARYLDSVVTLMTPVKTGERSWQTYRANFLNPRRVEAGATFWHRHAAALDRAAAVYGVPPEIVVAIIGVETEYGRNTGSFRVLDALATLAFDYPRRAEYFRSELEQFLLLAREARADAGSFRGSYAGAIGIPQFMPGSIRRYAVDFDGNGRIDLRGSPADAIGSVANFLAQHGWLAGAAIAAPAEVTGDRYQLLADGGVDPARTAAELREADVAFDDSIGDETPSVLIELESPGEPSEFVVGLQNFYVLTRYNRSSFYAAAVRELAAEVKAAYAPR
jgi:membrane-bound lytic murein transglycosylase B